MQVTNLEQRNMVLAPAVVEHRACPLSFLSEISGLNGNAKWNAGSELEQSGSGIATRLESLENTEKRRREVLEGRDQERGDARRGERARRRKVRHGFRLSVSGPLPEACSLV